MGKNNNRDSKRKGRQSIIQISDSEESGRGNGGRPRKKIHHCDQYEKGGKWRALPNTKMSSNERKKKEKGKGFGSEEQSQLEEEQEEQVFGFIKFNNERQDEIKKKISNFAMTPWVTKSTLKIKDSLLRFHNQIVDFYHYVKPKSSEHSDRTAAFEQIQKTIIEVVPGVHVKPFGSFATELYLPDSDVDVAVLSNNLYQVTQIYNLIHKRLLKQPNRFKNLEYIRKSKVPLIKFTYGDDDLHFDISVDKADGLDQVEYVKKIKDNYPEFKYLIMLFKCTLRIRGMSDTYTGGVGSFLLNCMVLYFLQEMHRQNHYYTLGEHVIRMMSFYGERDWSRSVIYCRDAMACEKPRDHLAFSMVSPQDQTHDIGKAAFKIRDVFSMFKNRVRFITGKNFLPSESILKTLVNPQDEEFKYIREDPKSLTKSL